MNAIETFFVWMGGYSPKNVSADHPEDRESITKIGAAILFAALVAFMNWGIAGWIYSEGVSEASRFVIAALAAAFGATIVLVFDRGFVYLADTASDIGRFKLFVYAAFRVGVIIAVGTITAQAIMPLLLRSELKAHSLAMVEASETKRAAKLNLQYDVTAKEAQTKATIAEVKRLETAAANIPADIQRRLNAAKRCWLEYSNQRAAHISAGMSLDDAQERLTGKASVCARDTKSAATEQDTYLVRTRQQLSRATDAHQAQATELADTKSTVKARLTLARDVEEDSLTPRSSTVLWDLLATNPGARAKWLITSFLLLVFELFPLIQKFQAGQSSVGQRIASNRKQRASVVRAQVQQAEHDAVVTRAVNAASLKGVEDAMQNPSVRATFAKAFADNIAALAPMEAVRAMMRDIEARNVDVVDFMHRFPRYASVIAQAWSKAVEQTAGIMAGAAGGAPAGRGASYSGAAQ